MSNWGHSHYKFIFLDVFNSDKSYDEIGNVVKGFQAKLIPQIGTIGNVFKNEVKVNEGHMDINSECRRYWMLEVIGDDNFSDCYVDLAFNRLLPSEIQLQPPYDNVCFPLFCKTFRCICDWCYDHECSLGQKTRVICGVNGMIWFKKEQQHIWSKDYKDIIRTEPEDIETKPDIEDIIREHFEEAAIQIDMKVSGM